MSTQWAYLVKIFFGNPDIHYEASHRAKLRTVEIGLHFESDDLTNARLLGAFRIHERAIRRSLAEARFEEWDRGWTRIWEPVAYEAFDASLQGLLAHKLAAYITTLEPILRSELPADVPWHVAPAVTRRRSSARRRAGHAARGATAQRG